MPQISGPLRVQCRYSSLLHCNALQYEAVVPARGQMVKGRPSLSDETSGHCLYSSSITSQGLNYDSTNARPYLAHANYW